MPVIKAENLSKNFKIFHRKNSTLKEKIIFFKQKDFTLYEAVKNVSFQIDKGESVALIGKNGSGKSTILKLLTRIIYPDFGTIEMNGTVSSLLELGAGFHQDFTGKENIFLNASILGFSKQQILEKLDEIIDFSELGQFINNPVKTYSSGMYMRLGFSVATIVNPDIILIDEVLTVGDAAFQRKCIDKLMQFKAEGKTIVCVSHDASIIEALCDKAIWINNGSKMMEGQAKEVVNGYMEYMEENGV
ncbi:ABC transporter ATP-binding protein [Paenibacillus sp. GYB004]|uniref:ABC transporter ATP-binding protein n=1 Tax=Paenibacillus sp. GYB004 TaxID=2994393 RepID=UPI002F961BDD